MMTKLKILIALLACLQTITVHAQRGRGGHRPGHGGGMGPESIILEFYGQTMQGQSTIALKQEIKKQRPFMDLQQLELESVRLVAKSMAGKGQAQLVVGQSSSYAQVVNGSPYDFASEAPYTYDRPVFQNPSYRDQGKWQIKLQGMFKVKRVIVYVKKKFQAQQSFQIMMNIQSTGAQTIKLKQALKAQYPYLKLNESKLVSVELMAKSKHGQGQAKLQVGQSFSFAQKIAGAPHAFSNESPYTYHSIQFMAPYQANQGVWQIDLNGSIKVKSVKIVLQEQSFGRF